MLDSLELTEIKNLLEQVGLLAEVEASDQPYTLFAPNNAAINTLRDDPNGPDLTDDEVVKALLQAHLSTGESLTLNDLANLKEVSVDNGGPQQIDAEATPLTVGDAGIIFKDNVVVGGIVQVINAVLELQ